MLLCSNMKTFSRDRAQIFGRRCFSTPYCAIHIAFFIVCSHLMKKYNFKEFKERGYYVLYSLELLFHVGCADAAVLSAA